MDSRQDAVGAIVGEKKRAWGTPAPAPAPALRDVQAGGEEGF